MSPRFRKKNLIFHGRSRILITRVENFRNFEVATALTYEEYRCNTIHNVCFPTGTARSYQPAPFLVIRL